MSFLKYGHFFRHSAAAHLTDHSIYQNIIFICTRETEIPCDLLYCSGLEPSPQHLWNICLCMGMFSYHILTLNPNKMQVWFKLEGFFFFLTCKTYINKLQVQTIHNEMQHAVIHFSSLIHLLKYGIHLTFALLYYKI